VNRQEVTLIQVVRCFERSVAFMREQVADLSDEDLLLQPAGAPNHGAWTIGHVIHSCHEIARILGALAWLPDDWEARFGYGSSPHDVSPSSDVSKVVLLGSLSEAGERLCDALQRAGGDQLGAALPGEGGGAAFATVGDAVVQIVCAHTAFHAGQLAAWRRAIGKKPVGVFV
jgi:hypothetical protein